MPIPLPPPLPPAPVGINPGDWTGSLNGLAFGPGTPYMVEAVDGWRSMSALALGGITSGSASTMPPPKGQSNGSWSVPFWMPKREVTLMFSLEQSQTTGQSWASVVQAFEAATQPNGAGVGTLSLQQDGLLTSVTGVVEDRGISTDFAYQFGSAKGPVKFLAFDPRRLAASLSASTLLPTSTGGLTWPVTWPISWPATQVTGVMSLINLGTATGPLTFTITGPCTGPTITQQETGLTLAFSPSLVINAGDTLVIDCEAQTALYNGQASRSGYLINRGWMGFAKGVNTFSFNAAAYNSSAALTVSAAPAYI